MKQNNKENVLCIGEIIIFIATTYLLLNSFFLANITRIIISGVVSFFFIILSDHVKKEFNFEGVPLVIASRKKGSKENDERKNFNISKLLYMARKDFL